MTHTHARGSEMRWAEKKRKKETFECNKSNNIAYFIPMRKFILPFCTPDPQSISIKAHNSSEKMKKWF